jgi:hypothetical protein
MKAEEFITLQWRYDSVANDRGIIYIRKFAPGGFPYITACHTFWFMTKNMQHQSKMSAVKKSFLNSGVLADQSP